MTGDRWRELAARLDHLAAKESLPRAICQLAVERLAAPSVGLTLCLGDSFSRLADTSAVAGHLDEQQFALGEGPLWDCLMTAVPVLAVDLAAEDASRKKYVERWPSFCREANERGIDAAFALPLQVGLVTVAVLTVYRDHTGPLTSTEYVDGLSLAALATTALMAERTGEHAEDLAEVFRAGVHERSRLHRAAGMVAERASIPIVEAMVRLRAHAYATGRPLGDIARDICDRRLVLPAEEQP